MTTRPKRFYRTVTVDGAAPAFRVLLDGRPIRTPAKRELAVPSKALAEAVATEWDAQGERIDPASMPLTRLVNSAIDGVTGREAEVRADIAQYGASDLLCYRAEGPAPLVSRQAQSWDPILAWAQQYYDAVFELASGITHMPQPPESIARLNAAVAARDPFALAGLSPLVTISGSLLVALALAEGAISLDTAWAAATLDEQWQAEHWGDDAEAAAALANRRRDFEAAARFLALL